MADNREYEEGTIYEAGVGIYFSDGEDHTNINVEDEVLAQINQNTEDIEALDTRMTTAEGNISALDGRLTTAEGDIDNLEGRMTTAEGDIDALEGRMNTAEGDITALEGRMTTAEGDIDNLEGRMTTAEGDIDALEGRMTTAEGDIDAVELRVTAIENDPTTVDVGTTTTGAEGTQASVTNSGTTHNAVFNFTIPKGDTGATGPQGPTGPAGPGVAAGGTAGQVLSKVDGTDYNTQWVTPSGGGGVKNYYITSSNISSWRVPSDDNYDVYIDAIPVTSWPTASTSIIKIVPVAAQQTIYVRVRKFDNKYVNEATYYSESPKYGHITFYRPGTSGTWYVKENHDYIFGKLYITGTDITFSVSDAGRNVEQLLKTICTNSAKLYYSSILNAPFYVTEVGSSNKGVEYYRITWEGTSNATRAMVITGCVACNAANAILNFKINYVVNDGTITKSITKVTTS